jgi:hypothetical protein
MKNRDPFLEPVDPVWVGLAWVDPQVFHSLVKQRLYEAHRKGRKSLTYDEAYCDLSAILWANSIRRELKPMADWFGERFFVKLAHALKTQKTPTDKRQEFIIRNRDLFQQMSHAQAIKVLRVHGHSMSVDNYASVIKRLGLTSKKKSRRKTANSAFDVSEKRGEHRRHEEKTGRESSRCRKAR